MYLIWVFLGILTLTKGNIFGEKVQGLGSKDRSLTAVKNRLKEFTENVTKLEKEIDDLKKKSCASVSVFRAELQEMAASAAAANVFDMSEFVLKTQLSEADRDRREVVNTYEKLNSKTMDYSDLQDVSTNLEKVNNAMKTQVDRLTNLEHDIQNVGKATSNEVAMTCSPGWTSFNKHCYALVRDKMPWMDAMSSCVGRGAFLLEINTEEELNFVVNVLLSSQYSENVWTGGTDAIEEGKWLWAGSGEKFNPKLEYNWSIGQPDNYLNKENYMDLTSYSRKFNDHPAEYKKMFICEQWVNK